MPATWTSTGSSSVTHVAVGRADVADRAVLGVRLAGAGRAGDEHESLRLGQHGRQQLALLAGQPGPVESGDALGAGEQPDDDLLAVHRRQRADARLDRQAVDRELRAAVLRAAALRDVETRHDLDAAHRCGGGRARHGHDVAQQTVDAVADAQVARLRLDVHVAGPRPHGVGQHDVHEADDRRCLHGLPALVGLCGVVRVELLEQRRDVGGVLRERPAAGEVVADLAVGGDDDRQLGRSRVELDVVERDHVGGAQRRQ